MKTDLHNGEPPMDETIVRELVTNILWLFACIVFALIVTWLADIL